jgi:hypothetical protein
VLSEEPFRSDPQPAKRQAMRCVHEISASSIQGPTAPVCTENLIRVDAVMESPKLAE